MPISWTNAAQGVAYLVGDPDYTGTSEADVKLYLLEASRELARQAHVVAEEGAPPTVADQADYPLGTTAAEGSFFGSPYRIIEAWVQRGTNDWVRMREMNDRDRPAEIYSEFPTHFIFRAGRYTSPGTSQSLPVLTLQPRPLTVYAMRVWALVDPTDEAVYATGLQHPVESELTLMLMAAREIRRLQGNAAAIKFFDQCIADEAAFVLRGRKADWSRPRTTSYAAVEAWG